ncbi:MAG: BlaI/MecI/CopY family transcriptional regulator [Bacteroidaceae bacterium]|nr:BlaI/MecI/CopY family transcriptional regulator [Bacteroidaceae bacterium]
MKKLTDKELSIMNVLWDNGALPMRDILERLPEPQPHFNTLATFVRRLENSGMISHRELGTRFFLYEAAVTRDKYAEQLNKESVSRFFGGSYMEFISCLVQQQEVSIDELKELINMIEQSK